MCAHDDRYWGPDRYGTTEQVNARRRPPRLSAVGSGEKEQQHTTANTLNLAGEDDTVRAA